MIIVQDILVEWTKDARGAPGAAQRNAVPESLPLPATPGGTQPECIIYHSARFAYQFSSPQEKLDLKRWDQDKYVVGPIWITPEVETYRVVFDGSDMGAPERDVLLPRTLFVLAVSQWGQVVYNSRLSGWDAMWTYQKRVLNVGFYAEASSDLFTRSKPNYQYHDMAKLW